MRKAFSVLMLISMYFLSMISDVSAYSYLQNFDALSVGSLSGQLAEIQATGNPIISENASYTPGNALRLYKNNSDFNFNSTARLYFGNGNFYSPFTSADDTISFWYYPSYIRYQTNTCNLLSMVGLYGQTSDLKIMGVRATSTNNGTFYLDSSNCTKGTAIGNVSAGNWYFIEVKFDFTNHNYKARINGGDWSVPLPISSIVNHIYSLTFQTAGTAVISSDYYVDNLIVGPLGTAFPDPQLTIVRNPAEGGGVSDYPAGENIYCGIDNYEICQASFELNTEVTLDAYPNADWAFAYWDDGTTCLYDNPLTVTMDSAKTLTTKFFKTFTNRVGNFQASVGSTIDTGQCVPYVRYETDVPIYGDAYTWYGQAVSANYATSATVPRVGSIIVFAIQSGMTYGHVGIVTSINGSSLGIRSQNWNNDEKVSDDTIDVSGYTIIGYIYYTP